MIYFRGAGPTGVFLKQDGPWTIGFLANHIWSFAGDDDHADISSTFLQPFCSYLFKKTFTTVGLNTETTYNWQADESSEAWSVPVNLAVNQLLKIGGKPVQFSVGVRYWADSPERGPDGFGARAGVTFLFPK